MASCLVGPNMMTPELLEDFVLAVDQVKADDSVRVVVLTGSGKSFCAGADFKSSGMGGGKGGIAGAHEAVRAFYPNYLSIVFAFFL